MPGQVPENIFPAEGITPDPIDPHAIDREPTEPLAPEPIEWEQPGAVQSPEPIEWDTNREPAMPVEPIEWEQPTPTVSPEPIEWGAPEPVVSPEPIDWDTGRNTIESPEPIDWIERGLQALPEVPIPAEREQPTPHYDPARINRRTQVETHETYWVS